MPKLDKLNRLKKLSEKQRDQKANIEGRIESMMEELKKEGFDSIEDAKKGLLLLNKKITLQNKSFNKKLEEFNKRYATEIQKSCK